MLRIRRASFLCRLAELNRLQEKSLIREIDLTNSTHDSPRRDKLNLSISSGLLGISPRRPLVFESCRAILEAVGWPLVFLPCLVGYGYLDHCHRVRGGFILGSLVGNEQID